MNFNETLLQIQTIERKDYKNLSKEKRAGVIYYLLFQLKHISKKKIETYEDLKVLGIDASKYNVWLKGD